MRAVRIDMGPAGAEKAVSSKFNTRRKTLLL